MEAIKDSYEPELGGGGVSRIRRSFVGSVIGRSPQVHDDGRLLLAVGSKTLSKDVLSS
jgi:hypothetical protein